MDSDEFQEQVIDDLTKIKISVALLNERMTVVQEGRRDVKKAMISAGLALFALMSDIIIRWIL